MDLASERIGNFTNWGTMMAEGWQVHPVMFP